MDALADKLPSDRPAGCVSSGLWCDLSHVTSVTCVAYICRSAALDALRAYPSGLQLGGGVTADNAAEYLDAGASHVIVTSFVFREGRLDEDRLKQLVRTTMERDVLTSYHPSPYSPAEGCEEASASARALTKAAVPNHGSIHYFRRGCSKSVDSAAY